MRLAIFSDVHGNLPALELMIKDAGQTDGYICLGDMVNYGPWSNECVDIISGLSSITIIEGNHERYFLEGSYSGSNPIPQAFFEFCYPSFTNFEKIKGLVEEYTLKDFTFRHTTAGETYIYPDSDINIDKNYVVGHSHHQFKIHHNSFVLYNPGSVGQNRKFINVINYMILETDSMNFEFKSLVYDEQLVIKQMKALNYPAICIDYYNNKERF